MTNQTDCPSLKTYLSEIGRYPLLTSAEELELGRVVATTKGPARKKAIDRLILCNLRLVVSVAKKYQGNNIPMLDLIQDGSIGLGRAAVKYDYKKGYKFSTYAYWWIKQGITRSLATQGKTIRIPIHRTDYLQQLRRTTSLLAEQLGRSPSSLEIAVAAGISIEELEQRVLESQPCISYDLVVGDGVSTLQDIAIGGDSGGEELVYLSQTKDVLGKILENLTDKERTVIVLRHGLSGGAPMTYNEVGREMDLSYEKIRQLSSTAKRKMCSPKNQRVAAKFYA